MPQLRNRTLCNLKEIGKNTAFGAEQKKKIIEKIKEIL